MSFDILTSVKNALFSGKSSNSKNRLLGLQDFYLTATERGFARDFHLRVTQIGDSTLGNEDLIYIRSATIPERVITTDSVYFRGFKYNVPLTASYPGSDSWTIEILMDKKYEIYDKLEKWHRSYFNENTFIGREIPTFDKIIELIAIDDQLNTIKKYRLYGCFPCKLGSIKYNLGGAGAPVSVELTLAYQYWTSETISVSNAQSQSLLDKFLSGLRTVTGVIQSGTNVVRAIRSI